MGARHQRFYGFCSQKARPDPEAAPVLERWPLTAPLPSPFRQLQESKHQDWSGKENQNQYKQLKHLHFPLPVALALPKEKTPSLHSGREGVSGLRPFGGALDLCPVTFDKHGAILLHRSSFVNEVELVA